MNFVWFRIPLKTTHTCMYINNETQGHHVLLHCSLFFFRFVLLQAFNFIDECSSKTANNSNHMHTHILTKPVLISILSFWWKCLTFPMCNCVHKFRSFSKYIFFPSFWIRIIFCLILLSFYFFFARHSMITTTRTTICHMIWRHKTSMHALPQNVMRSNFKSIVQFTFRQRIAVVFGAINEFHFIWKVMFMFIETWDVVDLTEFFVMNNQL